MTTENKAVKPYPDRLCHLNYTAHPHLCGCLQGDDEAQRRFDEHQRAVAANMPCCIPTEEDKALLASGDYTPEELYGVGGKPSCPKCHTGQVAVAGVQVAAKHYHPSDPELLTGTVVKSIDHATQIAFLLAQISSLEADAGRYRFLRDENRAGLEYWDGEPVVATDEDTHTGESLDAVVDSAISRMRERLERTKA